LPFEAGREVSIMFLFALAAIMGGISFVYVKKRRQRKTSS
jgi:LPXTG-motif cell wall-anchored protein